MYVKPNMLSENKALVNSVPLLSLIKECPNKIKKKVKMCMNNDLRKRREFSWTVENRDILCLSEYFFNLSICFFVKFALYIILINSLSLIGILNTYDEIY